MADRPRDVYDVLGILSALSTPDISADDSVAVLDAFQTPPPDVLSLSDGVSFPNAGHSGTYYWDDPTTLWNRFQWS